MRYHKLLLVFLFVYVTHATIKVDPKTQRFVDEYGRERLFHGVNAVYKIPPWHPDLDGFTPQTSLSTVDINNLAKWGFNAIRLGVMWPGVAPVRRQFNETYIKVMKNLVDELGKKGIYSIVDCHQDVFNRKFCGEGAPDWAVNTGNTDIPFPIPALGLEEFKNGPDGYPPLSECLKYIFGRYYFAEKTSAAFQSLYDNTDGIQDEFTNYWSKLASTFQSSDSILGYELINEPWVGNMYFDPSLLEFGVADSKNLEPMYKKLNTAIRKYDEEHIIFFEKTVESILFPSGFSEGPGGISYNDRQVFSYHVYCGGTDRNGSPKNDLECLLEDAAIFEVAMGDIQSIGCGGMMTEFGAMANETKAIININNLTSLADDNLQSWSYWQFKQFKDLTTAGNGESFYNTEGQLEKNKVKALSRTYARSISGHTKRMTFDPTTSKFQLQYAMNTSITVPTQIYLNEEWYYPSGYTVVLSPESVATWKAVSTNIIEVYISSTAPQGTLLSVSINPK